MIIILPGYRNESLGEKKKKSNRKSGVASQTVFHRSQEFQGPSAMCHVPGPSRPRFTPSVRLICGQPSMCPSSLASRSAQPTQIGEEWIPDIYTTFVALEPAHRVPGCYLGTEMPWEMPWGIPEPARQSFADQPSTPVNCNWCEPSCLMAFRQKSQVTLKSRYSIVSLSLPFFFFLKAVILPLLPWEMRNNKGDSFCQILNWLPKCTTIMPGYDLISKWGE